ncbi:MAG: hypothetical protein VX586_02175, partial [Candidatus Neomarinimicrobiota bacterium]|nr:hypothetical protein [Candidatus Neomarinimicrobiota bacterium]
RVGSFSNSFKSAGNVLRPALMRSNYCKNVSGGRYPTILSISSPLLSRKTIVGNPRILYFFASSIPSPFSASILILFKCCFANVITE